MKQTNWYKNTIPSLENYPGNDWYRTHTERNFDIVNIGSSSGLYAFDYTDTGIKAFNWALQPQSMEYSLKVLKNYFSILRQKGIVVIPFSPFSGLSVTGKWTETANDKYYHILDSTLIEDYQNVRNRRMYPLFYSPKQSIKRLIKDVEPKNSANMCGICHTDGEFTANAESWILNWKKEFDIKDFNEPLSEENRKRAEARKHTINDIILFCLERNLKPVIVIPPMHPALVSKFTPEFRRNYIYDFIKSVNECNIPFYDYMDSAEFRDNRFYINPFFMSKIGARTFTKMFVEGLKEDGILETL